MVGSFDLHCFEGRESSIIDKGSPIFGGFRSCVYTLDYNRAPLVVAFVLDDDEKTFGVKSLKPDRSDWWFDVVHVISMMLGLYCIVIGLKWVVKAKMKLF